jgi:hypothetical protein
MPQEQLDWCWMRNKDFYLGILDDIYARMNDLNLSFDQLSSASGLEQLRINQIFSGMIEDLTLLELDNLLGAVKATPRRFLLE